MLVLSACGSAGGGGGTGGGTNTGGTSATGGFTGTGGTTTASGGSTGTGGRATGGVTGAGNSATGGVTGTGGSATGGLTGAGGSLTGTGGGATAGTGGRAGNGGTGTAGAAGRGTGGSTTGGTGGGSTDACPATSMLKAGDNNETITSGGESRTFIVHVPSSYSNGTPAPVVLDFHPLGGTGSQQEGSSGWKAQCDSVGCIAVFPDSSAKAGDKSWNAGYCCENSEKMQIDDVQFARDMVKWLKANACIDSRRIYASGGSNGGGMTYRLACEAADMIAAVAPVDFRCVTGKDPLANAGSVTAANNTACVCKLPRPIAVVAYDEATDNSIVPYKGAQTPGLATDCPASGSCVGIGFPGAVVNAQTWAAFDGCGSAATTYSGNSICQQYPSCMGNTTVMLCTNNSSSHLAAYSSSAAKVAATAWGVFKDQTLP